MRSRPLAVALLISAAACSETSRFPAPDGGLPNGTTTDTIDGGGGGAPIIGGPLISDESAISNWEAETHLAVAPDGRMLAVWIALQLGGRRLVAYARSDDGGGTWSKPQLVPSDPANNAVDPSVTVDSKGTFHLAWLELSAGGQRRIMTAAYLDGGDAFTVPAEVSDPLSNAVWDKPWIVSLEGGALVVAWGTETGSSLFFARSADGDSWNRTEFAPDGVLRNVAVPCVAGKERVYVTYLVPGGVELARSDDGGATWSKPIRADEPSEAAAFEAPSCAAAGDEVWVLYGLSPDVVDESHTPLLDGIRLVHSNDGGATIAERRALGSGVRSLLPFVSRAPNGRLDVTYYAGTHDGDTHAALIWERTSDGAQWDEPTTVRAPLTLVTERDGFGWLGDYLGAQSADDALYVTFADNAGGAGLLSHVRFGKVAP